MGIEVIRDGDLVLTPGEFGRVVGDASGPMVVVDHDGHCAVYELAEVEAVVGVSERDAVIAERDRLRRELEQLRNALMGGPNDDVAEWADAILRGVKIVHPTGGHEARIRRELEALRDALRERVSLFDGDVRRSGAELAYEARMVAARIDAILTGEGER